MVGSTDRKEQAHDTETQQTSAHLRDRAVVDLFLEAETSQQEGHS